MIGGSIKNNTISLLLSEPLNYIILEVEGQPQYFTDRKTDLIVFDRISTRFANVNGYRTKEETQMKEVSEVQSVKSPFSQNTTGNVRTGVNTPYRKGAVDSQV